MGKNTGHELIDQELDRSEYLASEIMSLPCFNYPQRMAEIIKAKLNIISQPNVVLNNDSRTIAESICGLLNILKDIEDHLLHMDLGGSGIEAMTDNIFEHIACLKADLEIIQPSVIDECSLETLLGFVDGMLITAMKIAKLFEDAEKLTFSVEAA